MIANLLVRLMKACPRGVERKARHRAYELLARRFPQPEWTFMNWGYDDGLAENALALSETDEPNRYSIQLYDHVASATDFRGKDVLEVGCGRGGGAAWLARNRAPRSMTGMDYAHSAAELCRRLHVVAGLDFRQGDATAMPFEDASFDAVINVESSHCYGSMGAFVGEVARVLRPGGVFSWVDLWPARDVAAADQLFAASGLSVYRELDISRHVLRALDQVSLRNTEAIRTKAPWYGRGLLKEFAAVNGSADYSNLASGRIRYLSRAMRKQ